MDRITRIFELRDAFFRIVNKYNDVEKIPLDHGTGELLFTSETNTLEAIGKNPGMNVTGLARQSGLTKGAISQMVGKLVKKELVRKYKADDNEKEVLVELTAKGWTAFHSHERLHARWDAPMVKELSGMAPDHFAGVEVFFETLEDILDESLRELT
jgi:DNA-binding MarR family transcriptional regulator